MKACFVLIGGAIVSLAVFACTVSAATVIYDQFDDPATLGDGTNGTLWYVPVADGFNVPTMSDSILNIDQITAASCICSKTQYGPGTIVEFKMEPEVQTSGHAMGFSFPYSSATAMLRNDQGGGIWQLVVDNRVDDIFRSGDVFDGGGPTPGSLYAIAWYDNFTVLFEDGEMLTYAPIAMSEPTEIFAYTMGHMGWDYVAVGDMPAILPGDANFSQTVDEVDAAILASNWLLQETATWTDGDFNGDGNVDDADATIMATNWIATGPTAAVPEPSTLALLAIFLWAAAACRSLRGDCHGYAK